MDNSIISKNIKTIRRDKMMTQKEFGKLIGVTQATLSTYEQGLKTPNTDTLYNIAEKCDISMDWLCGRTNLKNIENFDSYSDVFKTIVKLCKSVKFSIIEDSNNVYKNDVSQHYLEPGNTIVNDFLNRWRKVKEIYDDKTIDEETYDTVVNSLIERYKDIEIIYDDDKL